MWRKYWDRSGNSSLLPRQRRPWGVKLTTIFNPTFVSDGFRIKWPKTLSEYHLICNSKMVYGFNFAYHIIIKVESKREEKNRLQWKAPNEMSSLSQSDDPPINHVSGQGHVKLWPCTLNILWFTSFGPLAALMVWQNARLKNRNRAFWHGVAGLLTRGGGNNHFRTPHA